jgi:uncharacterized secreted protein with C-terminal beta-propeller domain
VLDLSNPENPVIKGKLEIPGYSSYLHPYDETHIIGIGYNTKSNGYGGIATNGLKISMFDVSDLNSPKEIFSINVGNTTNYSEVTSNHKALFYDKDRNLIGFPVVSYYKNRITGLMIYQIDLENNRFIEYGDLTKINNYDYSNTINRAIYIDNTLYTLSPSEIIAYDLDSLVLIKNISLK